MTNKILLKFAKKGINLSPEAYKKVIEAENPLDFTSSLIVKLKGGDFKSKDLVSVSGQTVDEIMENSTIEKSTTRPQLTQKETKKPTPEPKPKEKPKKTASISDFKKESDVKEKYVNKENAEALETVENKKIKFKRNLTKTNVEYDFKIIQDTSKKSYTSGELENLIAYFQSRYEKLANILVKRPELKNYTKVADIEEGQSNLSLILMVREIRSTKNGHKLIEFEDDTGTIPILFSNKNEEVFKEAEKLVKDEVIGVLADKNGDLAIGNEIINPGVMRIPIFI